MLITTMNTNDLEMLQQFRVQRFICFFATSLQFCSIQISTENILNIYCPHEGFVDELLYELEDLCHYAYLILGVYGIFFHWDNPKCTSVNAVNR
jgi:hypothetical protein